MTIISKGNVTKKEVLEQLEIITRVKVWNKLNENCGYYFLVTKEAVYDAMHLLEDADVVDAWFGNDGTMYFN